MMSLRRYTDEDRSRWDEFVDTSKNGTFLFRRDYLEYHRDRFADHSLLFFDQKERLVALLPANETTGSDGGKTLHSHAGLTYGGLVMSAHTSAAQVLDIFESLACYARDNYFRHIVYKPVPTIYHLQPAEEDRYALFRIGAVRSVCNLSCSVALKDGFTTERRRLRGRTKAVALGYSTEESTLGNFWTIMTDNLRERYGAKPVHTLAEMEHLQQLFPLQIRCFVAKDAEGKPQAGAVLYVTRQTVHVQYGHATPQGKQDGALDLLYISLISHYGQESAFRYFDFGTSNEQQGHILNENLIAQKEGFGGRGIAYETYEWDISQ